MKDLVPVDDYARRYGFRTSAVVSRIQKGIIAGRLVDNEWFVELNQPAQKGSPRHTAATTERSVINGEQVRHFLKTWFAPRFDEATLYVLSISFLAMLILDPTLQQMTKLFFWNRDLQFWETIQLWIYGVPLAIGLILPIYHAAIVKDKKPWERHLMLTTAILIYVETSLFAAVHLLRHDRTEVFWMFPVWNFLSAYILMFLFRFEVIDESIVGDEDAGLFQLLVATVVVGVCAYYFNEIVDIHIAIALSATFSFATTISVAADRIVFHTLNFLKA